MTTWRGSGEIRRARAGRVDGVLGFADKRLHLKANWIMVHGRLTAGTAKRPLRSRVTITLTDRNPANDVMGMGPNVLGVMGGAVELHGHARTSWLRQAETAAAVSGRVRPWPGRCASATGASCSATAATPSTSGARSACSAATCSATST